MVNEVTRRRTKSSVKIAALLLLIAGGLVLIALERVASFASSPTRAHLVALLGGKALSPKGVVFQRGEWDCGRAVYTMLTGDAAGARDIPVISGKGASMANLLQALNEKSPLWVFAKGDISSARHFPVVAYLRWHHYVIVDSDAHGNVVVRDPSLGRIEYPAFIFQLEYGGYMLERTG